MVGRHDDVAMAIEDEGFAITKLVSKEIAANKLCIPNHIELRRGAGLAKTVARRFGFRPEGPTSRRSIDDYLALGDVRILAILRDGNAVISSIMKRGGQTFDTAAYRWRRAVEIVQALREQVPDRLQIVSYEALVTDPEQVMRDVCSFLRIPFQEKVLEGYRFNPIYPGESGIDAARARRHEQERTDFALERRFPEALRTYRQLVGEDVDAS